MNDLQIQQQVEAEVGKAWPEFEQAHPALAAELGRAYFIAEALGQLRTEPAYQQAIRDGTMLAMGAEQISRLLTIALQKVMGL